MFKKLFDILRETVFGKGEHDKKPQTSYYAAYRPLEVIGGQEDNRRG